MSTGNNVTIIGRLVENKLGKGVTKDGRNYINGYTVVSDGTNNIRTDYISMEQTTNGLNPSYREILKLMNEGVCDDLANGIKGSIIKISSSNDKMGNGQLDNSDYYDKDGNLVSNVKITASFPRIVNELSDKEKMGAMFSFTGYIDSMFDEIKNDELTGRLNVTLVGIRYNDSANPVSFVIPKEFADAFKNTYSIGQTMTLDGQVINIMETKVVETPVLWGTPTKKTQTTFIREFRATGGSAPFNETDPGAISTEVITAAKAKREEKLQQDKKNAAERAKVKQAQNTAASGFAGNSGAFAAATVNPIGGGNGRPQF